MQSMSTTTTELTKNTALLQLRAEDTASRLGLLEADAVARRAVVTEPITPTTTVVRTDTKKQPRGRGETLHVRGQDSGVTRPPDLPSGNEIRTAVILHCLEDVETASLLAKLQESELELDKTGGFHRQRDRDKHKSASVDRFKGAGCTDDSAKPEIPRWDNKLEALRAHRKSKGQCFTCGEKWNKTHKCDTQVPLHIVEELLEVLQIDNEDRQSSSTDSSSEDDLMLLAPLSAPSTPRRRRTMRLHGMIDKHPVLILVDSGANASFIDDKLAALLNRETEATAPARFVAANGAPLTSDKKMPMLTWLCQGHSFQQDFQVLPLPCYDIILGADWLEDH
ncbi:hypothetical protein QYE76_004653 [Lolium multiflorum]|uniref:Uncharacterized protein n=1 Tax=Lolium multiflorum TaxID=4521 RepID=A0AAD8RSF8_LOLMU|nr:hypothetical protein QYE76_004653 [Lolium multiflorum]